MLRCTTVRQPCAQRLPNCRCFLPREATGAPRGGPGGRRPREGGRAVQVLGNAGCLCFPSTCALGSPGRGVAVAGATAVPAMCRRRAVPGGEGVGGARAGVCCGLRGVLGGVRKTVLALVHSYLCLPWARGFLGALLGGCSPLPLFLCLFLCVAGGRGSLWAVRATCFPCFPGLIGFSSCVVMGCGVVFWVSRVAVRAAFALSLFSACRSPCVSS